jgi:hypothetical protein
MRTALILLTAFAATPAFAQLGGGGLGGLPSPPLPVVRNLPGTIDRTLDGVTDTTRSVLDGAVLPRAQQVEDLLRGHRDVLELDPQGDLIVRNQVVAFAPTSEALTAAQKAGFAVSGEHVLEGLDTRMVVLTAPRGLSTKKALQALQKLDPDGTYDFNDIYLGSQSGGGGAGQPTGAGGGRVGLIDGGVDASHPAFRGAKIVQKGFAGVAAPSPHGTATGSLLVGRSDGFAGAAPGAELIVADVYCNVPTGGSTSAIIQALDWMSREKVGVVNISLTGPANAPLKAAVSTMVKRGHLIVAAVGNEGPAAKPLYPAAFDGVIGVTGVDRRNKVLLEAGRGAQVDLAAPGSDIAAAAPGGVYAGVRGTSFAAPIAAGLLAQGFSRPDPVRAASVTAALSARALDLGSKGRDNIYGAGLVGGDIRPDLKALKKKK